MEYKPNYLCDLHCHTTRSDGNDEPAELIQNAARLGMRAIAITDHDIVPPQTILVNGVETDTSVYARELGITVLLGCEISCDIDVEDVHILAFGCDWTDGYFASLEKVVQKSKVDAYRELVNALCAHGMDMTWEEVLYNAGKPRKPEEVQKKQIFELLAHKGYFPTWQEAKLAVKETPAFSIKRQKPDPMRAIEAIHNANGIAILAHPFLIGEAQSGGRERYIGRLIDAGLNGMEACYPYHKTSYGGTGSDEHIERYIRATYTDRVKILSGGSDYHADFKKGVHNARQIGECGVTPEYLFENPYLSALVNE